MVLLCLYRGVFMVEEEKKKLKLLVAAEAHNQPTGYGIVMKNLVLGLIKKGWDIWYVGFQHYGNPIQYGDAEGNRWLELQSGLVPMGEPGFPDYIGDYCDAFEPDIVFSLIDIFYTDVMIRECNNRAIPYVSYWPVDNPNFRLQWIDRLKYMSYPLTISKFGVRTVMDTVKKYGTGGWSSHFNIDYIYHGVDTKTFDRFPKEQIEKNREMIFKDKRKFPAGKDTFVYFFCGKNNRRKQIDRLLKAFSIVAKKYRDVVLFLKVGDPMNYHRLGLDIGDLLQKFDIIDRVKILDTKSNFLEGISERTLAGWYNVSDVHVSSTGGEGFGLTTIESFACGKPVIITDCSTSPELIGRGKDARGWLVPVKTSSYMDYNGLWSLVDIEKMAEIMEEAYLNRKEVKRRGNNAYRWVRENLTWDNIVDQFDKYLRKAVKEYSSITREDLKKLAEEDGSEKKSSVS